MPGRCRHAQVEIGDFVKRGDPIATYVDNRTIIVSANLSEFDAQSVDVDDRPKPDWPPAKLFGPHSLRGAGRRRSDADVCR